MTDLVARGLAKKAQGVAELANARLDALPNGIVYRGAVNYLADLDNLAAEIGDAYTVKYKGTGGTTPDGSEYVYGMYEGEPAWIPFGKEELPPEPAFDSTKSYVLKLSPNSDGDGWETTWVEDVDSEHQHVAVMLTEEE